MGRRLVQLATRPLGSRQLASERPRIERARAEQVRNGRGRKIHAFDAPKVLSTTGHPFNCLPFRREAGWA